MTAVDFTTGTRSSHSRLGTHPWNAAAGAADFPDGHPSTDTHGRPAVGEHNSQPTMRNSDPRVGTSAGPDFPDGQGPCDTHLPNVVGEHNPPAPATVEPDSNAEAPVLASNPWAEADTPLLALLADTVDDIEGTRKATANRLRQLTRSEADKDGEERGFGLTLKHSQVAVVADMLRAIKHDDKVLKDLGYPTEAVLPRNEKGKLLSRACTCLECTAIRNLQKELQQYPLGPWVKATAGVGEKQAARLLGTIGDPYWNTLYDRPRLVSELWQYAGHGDPARSRRRKGQLVEYSPTAKMRTHLVAESCMKQRTSPYRRVYEKRKAATEGRLHVTACVRCGPSGHPAPAGTPWSDAHRHADALRIVGKEILRDLWRESKRLHEGGAA